jgi:3-deoxy-D-manno-octulosonic-acid transferase
MIEPAAYGAAVCFGPNTWNFRDVVAALVAADAAVVVRDAAELEAFVRRALEDPAWAAALGQRARALVQSQLGATAHTIELIQSLTQPPTNRLEDRSAA